MKFEEIRPLQITEMVLLREVDRICKELNLRYYMIGGTLLGAVRHGGFIPWDIDVDVAMPREDYNQFREYCLTKDTPVFFYQDYMTEKNHASCHAILRLNGTSVTFTKKGNEIYPLRHAGIYLDIFPLDYVSDDGRKQKSQKRRIKILSALLQSKKCRDYGAGKRRYYMKRVLQVLLKPVSFCSLQKQVEKEMCRHNDGQRTYMVSMASHYSYEKQLMPAEVYGQPQKVLFEGEEFYAPAKIHEYLEQIYGDYMKLPPEEKRHAEISSLVSVDYGKYGSPED